MGVSTRTSQCIGAIDAGSNGIRLAIARLNGDGVLREIESVREAVRLGADAFDLGYLREPTIEATVAAFQRFTARIEHHGVRVEPRPRFARAAVRLALLAVVLLAASAPAEAQLTLGGPRFPMAKDDPDDIAQVFTRASDR